MIEFVLHNGRVRSFSFHGLKLVKSGSPENKGETAL